MFTLLVSKKWRARVYSVMSINSKEREIFCNEAVFGLKPIDKT